DQPARRNRKRWRRAREVSAAERRGSDRLSRYVGSRPEAEHRVSTAACDRCERERRLHWDKLAHLGDGYGSAINHHGFPWHWSGRPVPQSGGVPGRFDVRHSFSGDRRRWSGRVGEQLLPVRGYAIIAYPQTRYAAAPWHFLNFLPLPHGHGSLRPTPA